MRRVSTDEAATPTTVSTPIPTSPAARCGGWSESASSNAAVHPPTAHNASRSWTVASPVQAGRLHDQPDPRSPRPAASGRLHAENPDRPRRRLDEALECLDGRGLAGTVRISTATSSPASTENPISLTAAKSPYRLVKCSTAMTLIGDARSYRYRACPHAGEQRHLVDAIAGNPSAGRPASRPPGGLTARRPRSWPSSRTACRTPRSPRPVVTEATVRATSTTCSPDRRPRPGRRRQLRLPAGAVRAVTATGRRRSETRTRR
jgi:hypothetical protein